MLKALIAVAVILGYPFDVTVRWYFSHPPEIHFIYMPVGGEKCSNIVPL
jgi:hypothetical protein